MAFNAVFLTFDKKENSTKKPIIEPVTPNLTVLSVVLKEESSIINPILKVYNTANFNPYQLNYCYISKFGRYYFVNDWIYNIGEWECYLQIDALASFKTEIGNLYKFVLRSAHKEDPNIIDDLYPAVAHQPNYYYDNSTFGWSRTFSGGSYVLGLINNDSQGIGAVSYYYVSSADIRDFLEYMMHDTAANPGWLVDFTGLTDSLYRAIYDPFQYVKSCLWFPFSLWGTDAIESAGTPLKFGNYTSNIIGHRIVNNSVNWYDNEKTLELPSGWLSLKGKERSKPYAHVYLVCNPWGVIELDPVDFSDTIYIKVKIYPDLISGDCYLKIYKIVGTAEYFITQRTAKVSVDIPLTATTIDAKGLLAGGAGVVGGLATTAIGVATGKPSSIIGGTLATVGGVAGAAASMVPSISGSIGQTFQGIRAIDGDITLIYQNTYFTSEDPDDFGKPLYSKETLNTIPGFIKCADGHCEIAGAMKQEIEIIGDYLTDGFYFE